MINNRTFEANSVDDLWLLLWNSAKNEIKPQDSRDGEVVWECIDAHIIINDPTRNLSHNKIRDMSIKYAIGEFLWYEAATNKLKPIQKYTKGWDRMSDDGEHVNSNYGHLIKSYYGFDQLKTCFESLRSNRNSRQAVIHYKPAFDFMSNPTKDVPCTISQQFLIRDDKLHTIVTMRSNDIWNGIPYDVFFFTCNQIKLAMMLDVDVGIYMHNAGSLHMYKRDYKMALINEEKIKSRSGGALSNVF